MHVAGQGKTQIALEYCRRVRSKHSIFWVDASSLATVSRSFESIGNRLAPSGYKFPNPEAARAYVMKSVEQLTDPVLFVFDNFDKPSTFTNVKELLPNHGKILFASRNAEPRRLGQSIRVEAMPVNEGVELLLRQAGSDPNGKNIAEARGIVEKLAGLALAVDQAATYIASRRLPLEAFHQIYTEKRSTILGHVPSQWEYRKVGPDETEKPLSVLTTWEMSFEELEMTAEQRQSIIHLLTLSAFIDNVQIGEGLFKTYFESVDPSASHWLTEFVTNGLWDKDKYQDCIVRLLSIHLIQSIDIMTADARFSIHPLIAEWLRLRTSKAARDQYTEEAILVLRLFIDSGDKKEMPFRDKSEVLAHLATCTANEEAYHCEGHRVSYTLMDAMVSFGSFYRRLGRYEETRSLIERAMEPTSQHDITPAVRNVLANMYCEIWEHEKAEHLYNQVFKDLGKLPPARDMDERIIFSTLGYMYWTTDDKLALEETNNKSSNTGGYQDHEHWTLAFLSTLNGLGLVKLKEGRLQQAERLLTQALAGREQIQGLENPNGLNVVDHLGTVKLLEGDLNAAGMLYSRALRDWSNSLGRFTCGRYKRSITLDFFTSSLIA